MKIVTVACLLLPILAATAGQAQIGKAQVTRKIIPRDRTVVINPLIRQATVTLNAVPDSALQIATWPGLIVKRVAPAPPGAIPSAGATIYVSKAWINRPQEKRGDICDSAEYPVRHGDQVDLTAPRSHGFRLAAFSIEPIPPLKNYVPTYSDGPRRRGGSDRFIGADGQSTDNMAQAVKIPLRGTRYQYFIYPGMPVQCFTGYRVNISLRGPVDVDPWTGNPIRRSQVN
ncbi:hypothetical protein ACVWZA_004279 [Sphingomonas sp. UYAg733]